VRSTVVRPSESKSGAVGAFNICHLGSSEQLGTLGIHHDLEAVEMHHDVAWAFLVVEVQAVLKPVLSHAQDCNPDKIPLLAEFGQVLEKLADGSGGEIKKLVHVVLLYVFCSFLDILTVRLPS
jgi:hypothetical protein